MVSRAFVEALPKVELHVHLEGAIRPETLLKLAERNNVELPASDLDGLRHWYRFVDFPHFAEIFQTVSRSIRNADDIELIAREFLAGQAEQNILYTEATYSAMTQFINTGVPFDEQLAAINRARTWAQTTLGVTMQLIVDIARGFSTDDQDETVADWVIEGHGNGVAALGLGGLEIGYPPERYRRLFDRAREAGVPAVIHAGETGGPDSIRGAIDALKSLRIGHGVRCLEDASLVALLKERQIPLEVCPSSNICLGVFDSIEVFPLPKLMEAGLYLTLNSDDPPMFDTTLTDELMLMADTFGLSEDDLLGFQKRAANVALLNDTEREAFVGRIAVDRTAVVGSS